MAATPSPKTVTTWVALFRGINVGGNNKLPMAQLRQDLESVGLKRVRTYIQSGNVVFEAEPTPPETLTQTIADCVEAQNGFRPELLLLSAGDIQRAIDANPFPKAVSEPKFLHFLFLAEPATNADVAAIEGKKSATESFHLTKSVFYLHAPDGIGRSKLAASVERHLGVMATGRNYRTVDKIKSLIES